jgi:hypothetical protein
MARPTSAALIARVRLLINDVLPSGNGQIFTDDQIQDVLDEGRVDIVNGELIAKPTFSGSSIQYLDYYSKGGGGWEDGMLLKQYLTVLETPSSVEPIAGHFQFASNVFPPVYITGKIFDVYRASADLLERQAAQWALSYNVTADGQNLARSQVLPALINLANQYRKKQRAKTSIGGRSDIAAKGHKPGLQATELDYMVSGNKDG